MPGVTHTFLGDVESELLHRPHPLPTTSDLASHPPEKHPTPLPSSPSRAPPGEPEFPRPGVPACLGQRARPAPPLAWLCCSSCGRLLNHGWHWELGLVPAGGGGVRDPLGLGQARDAPFPSLVGFQNSPFKYLWDLPRTSENDGLFQGGIPAVFSWDEGGRGPWAREGSLEAPVKLGKGERQPAWVLERSFSRLL